MRYYEQSGQGHVYKRCVMCGCSFHVFRHVVRRGTGFFCSRKCWQRALRLFSLSLADEGFKTLLQERARQHAGEENLLASARERFSRATRL